MELQLVLSSIVEKNLELWTGEQENTPVPCLFCFLPWGFVFFHRNEHFWSFLDLLLPKRKKFDCTLIKLMLYSDLVACACSIVNDNLRKGKFCILGGLITSIPTCLEKRVTVYSTHNVCSAVWFHLFLSGYEAQWAWSGRGERLLCSILK